MEVSATYTTEFGEYTTLPAPDGRSYPTSQIETSVINTATRGRIETVGKMTFHFFPGRVLPELPKRVEILP